MKTRIFQVRVVRNDGSNDVHKVSGRDDRAARLAAILRDDKEYTDNNVKKPPTVLYCEISLIAESDN